jgi:hypothetical protein
MTDDRSARLHARARLRDDARHWFPTLPEPVVDRIVAAAWLEAAEHGDDGGTAVRAAVGVRRLALRALRGEALAVPGDVEWRLAALEGSTAAAPAEPPPPSRWGGPR